MDDPRSVLESNQIFFIKQQQQDDMVALSRAPRMLRKQLGSIDNEMFATQVLVT